jgi:hypothetical protein
LPHIAVERRSTRTKPRVIGRIAHGATVAFERIRAVNVERALLDLRAAILGVNDRYVDHNTIATHSPGNEASASGSEQR